MRCHRFPRRRARVRPERLQHGGRLPPASRYAADSSNTGEIAVTQAAGNSCVSFSVTSQASWIHITAGQTGGTVPGKVEFHGGFQPERDLSQRDYPNFAAECDGHARRRELQLLGRSEIAELLDRRRQRLIRGDGELRVDGVLHRGLDHGEFRRAGFEQRRGGLYMVDSERLRRGIEKAATIALSTGLPSPPAVTITQDGSPSNLTLSATSTTAPPGAADYRITVTTGDTCVWSARKRRARGFRWRPERFVRHWKWRVGLPVCWKTRASERKAVNIHVGALAVHGHPARLPCASRWC